MVNIDRITIKKHAIMKLKELSRAQKLEILKEAKKMYVDERHTGMCACLDHAILGFIVEKLHQDPYLYGFTDGDYDYLRDIFPEFNSFDLTGIFFDEFKYWWPLDDSKSRIEAFDKLIKIYSTTI